MVSNLKSFAIAFVVAILIFGCIGYFAIPQIKSLAEGFLTPGAENVNLSSSGIVVPPVPDPDSEITIGNTAAFPEHKSFTMLFVGTDYQPDVFNDYRKSVKNSSDLNKLVANQRHYKADVIMLLKYDAYNGDVILSALPPNMKVTVAGVTMTLGDVLEAENDDIVFFKNFVSGIVGMKIDYYIFCDGDGFKNIIRGLGDSIKYNLTKNMYSVNEEEIISTTSEEIPLTVNGRAILNSDGTPVMRRGGTPLTINLKSGLQTLDSKKALWVLRYNNYAGGFTERSEVLRDFFNTMFETYFTSEYSYLLSQCITDNNRNITTNITAQDYEEISGTLLSYQLYNKKEITFEENSSVNTVYSTFSKFADYKIYNSQGKK